jgi:hypothetical protein
LHKAETGPGDAKGQQDSKARCRESWRQERGSFRRNPDRAVGHHRAGDDDPGLDVANPDEVADGGIFKRAFRPR